MNDFIDVYDTTDPDDIDELLEFYFDKYSSSESILSVAELDGFFAALACAPGALMPSQWLPAMWGGEDQLPDWEQKEEIEEFHEALMTVYSAVMEEFLAGEYSPRFYTEEGDYIAVDEWCEGFFRGSRLYPRLSAEDQAFLDLHLEPIRLFVTSEGVDPLLEMTPDQVEEKISQIEPSLLALRERFFNRQVIEAHTPFMSVTEKIGRNDPCPCGSGKKFKKCCLH